MLTLRKSLYSMTIEQLNIIIGTFCTGFAAVAIAMAQFYSARSKAGYEQNSALIEGLRREIKELSEQVVRYQVMIDGRDETILRQEKELATKNALIADQDKMIASFRTELGSMRAQIQKVEEENIDLKKQMDLLNKNLNK